MDLGLSLRLKNNFAAGTGGVVESWWLSGGVSASDCLAAYQSIGADSYAASKINLANPGTYDITNGASFPSWNAATGWTFDGVDDYLDTNLPGIDTASTVIVYINGFNPANTISNYIISTTDNDWNSETAISLGYYLAGDPSPYFVDVIAFLNSGNAYSDYDGEIANNTPYILGVSLSGRYKDGVKIAWVSFTSPSYNTLRNYILGAVWGGSDYQNFGAMNILAAAIYNTTLTDDQVTAITTALQAL